MLKGLKYKKNKALLEGMGDQGALPSSILERFFSKIPLLLLMGILVAASISITAVYWSQKQTMDALKSERTKISWTIQDLTKKREKLEKELEEMSSPLYIEKQAREKLKMVKPEETVYVDIRKNP